MLALMPSLGSRNRGIIFHEYVVINVFDGQPHQVHQSPSAGPYSRPQIPVTLDASLER